MIGIAKVTDGFFTANEILASFRWSDFSINSYLPYVKLGERPLICSSFCGKKGAYTTECNVIVMDTAGKKLLEYYCSRSKPSGVSFDSDENIIVCLNYKELKQIRYDGKSSRCIREYDLLTTPNNSISFNQKVIC